MRKRKLRIIMLARTVPEDSKKHGQSVCACAWCEEERSLVRIYPIPIGGNLLKRWNVLDVNVCRPKDDSRAESWRLDCEGPADAEHAIEYAGVADREQMLAGMQGSTMVAESIAALNGARRSLGLLRLSYGREKLVCDDICHDPADRFTKAGMGLQPRLLFDEEGSSHGMQLNAWEVFRAMHNGTTPAQLSDRYHFGDARYDHLLLVGNMVSMRNRWIIAAVFPLLVAGRIEERLLF